MISPPVANTHISPLPQVTHAVMLETKVS